MKQQAYQHRHIPIDEAVQRKLRLLLIAGALGTGGTERQLALIADLLDKSRFEPLIMTLNPDAGDFWERKLSAEGFPILKVERGNRLKRIRKIISLVRNHEIDLIHSFHFYAHGYGAIAAKVNRVPIIGSIRFLPTQNKLREHVPNSVWRNIGLSGVDLLLTNSQQNFDLLQAQVRRDTKVMSIPNGTDSPTKEEIRQRRQHYRDKLGLGDEDVALGLVGRLNSNKNPMLFLQAFKKLLVHQQNLIAVIIGDGPLRITLEQFARENMTAQQVIFTGKVEAAAQWMPALDIICQTSRSEGMPNVLMEAGANGIPAVATNVGGTHEVVLDGRTGHLIPVDSLDALVTATSRLIVDAEKRTALGAAAHCHIQSHFSLENMINKHEALYQSLCLN